jgi:cytoskeletal protein RodZ
METSLISRATLAIDSKRRAEPILLPADAAFTVEQAELSLGQLFTDARERKGLTRQQVAREARLLVSYLEMMESGNYVAVPDLLYLLPFVRRYAVFLGLDVKDATSRFMRDFEAEEKAGGFTAARPVAAKRSVPWRRIAKTTLIMTAAILFAGLAIVIMRETQYYRVEVSPAALGSPAAFASPVALASPAAPVQSKSVSTQTQTSPPAVTRLPQPPRMAVAVEPQRKSATLGRHRLRGASPRHRRR